MRAILVLVCALVACNGHAEQDDVDTSVNAHQNKADCADGDTCITSGGRDGVCFDGFCAIPCASAYDCPLSDCRVGHCLNNVCAFVGAPNGEPCERDGSVGQCTHGSCATP